MDVTVLPDAREISTTCPAGPMALRLSCMGFSLPVSSLHQWMGCLFCMDSLVAPASTRGRWLGRLRVGDNGAAGFVGDFSNTPLCGDNELSEAGGCVSLGLASYVAGHDSTECGRARVEVAANEASASNVVASICRIA